MNQQPDSVASVLEWFLGGAITSLFAAAIGRLMFHSAEVKRGRRKVFGRELIGEAVNIIGMAVIGEAVAAYLALAPTVSTGFIAGLAYIGPRGAQVAAEAWFNRKFK